MRLTQLQKAEKFRALHEREGAFVIPNPWDAGSARILERLEFEALTTTSAGLAFALGRRDGTATRAETLANARAIVDATDLPVAADLENGFGDSPRDAAETIRLAGEKAGLVGGSIEDATRDPRKPIYDFEHAVDRIAAAVEAARALPFPFVLVARAENHLHGRPDLEDTIRRLQAFQKVGADALYAPGVNGAEDLRLICSSVSRPVNALVPSKGPRLSVRQLSALGVKRVSLGSAMSRAALGGFVRAAREIQAHGTFDFMDDALPYTEANGWMAGGEKA
jgi:2-methylisocitrate lyase-like PEP mutase family enzyme